MGTPPPLNLPRLGEAINQHELSYVKRASALKHAWFWNIALANDPVFGPTPG